MLRVAWIGSYVNTQHDDREATVQQGEIDLVHDQDLLVSEGRIALDYGITRQFGVSLVQPVRVVGTSIRYLAKSGGDEVDLVMPGIHHRDETLVGLGDPIAMGAFTTPLGGARLTIRAGLSLPLGATEDNPFTPEAQTMPHQHVQMGSGTFRPVLAAEAWHTRGKWQVGGFLFTQQSIYESGKGYKAGDRYAAGFIVARTLSKQWSLRGGAEVQGETEERWDGLTYEDDGNRGRIDAMISAGATYDITERLAFDATVKVPFVTHAVGGQLDMPAIVEIGAAWRFGSLARKKADSHSHEGHDHSHGDEHGDEHGDSHGDSHGDEHEHEKENGQGQGHGHGHDDAKGDEHDTPANDRPVTDKPATDKPATDKPATDKPATDKPVADKPATDKPATDKPIADKPAADKPATDKPATDKPATDKPATDKPAVKPKPADVAAYNKPGEAPDLVPVKGKITIFDFWATWCEPCKKLDPALVALAKKYPDRVAIRKLDVVDWDSKAAERYLTPGGFDLPHLKIYDASGKRILEKSSAVGKLDALIEEVRAIVEKR